MERKELTSIQGLIPLVGLAIVRRTLPTSNPESALHFKTYVLHATTYVAPPLTIVRGRMQYTHFTVFCSAHGVFMTRSQTGFVARFKTESLS